jgi:ABC-2 type transport system ATP-binding protein
MREVTVRFGAATALDAVSIEVEPGAVFALVGRNGAGKTTAIRALLGLLRPDAGAIAIDGRDPWRERAALLARVGTMPEVPDAPGDRPLAAVAHEIAPLYPRWDGAELARRFERLGVDPRRRLYELSRGERSLAMLALALAPTPELLVLDEPTLGLDALARRWFFEELVGDLADRGATVLLASHDLDGVERVATDVGVLAGGRVVARGTVDELRARAAGDGLRPASLEEIVVATAAREAAR